MIGSKWMAMLGDKYIIWLILPIDGVALAGSATNKATKSSFIGNLNNIWFWKRPFNGLIPLNKMENVSFCVVSFTLGFKFDGHT